MKSNRFLSWAPAELFFIFSEVLTSAFAILSGGIASQLKLTESDLGLLSGVFFITYAVGQLVLGILIARVPARLVLGFTALVSAAGAFVMSMSDGLIAALIGQAVLGIGVSSAFVGVIYLVSRGYGKNFAFMSSLSLSLANLSSAGLAISSAFLPLLADFRVSFQVSAILFVMSAVLVFAFVGSQSPLVSSEANPPLSAAFKAVVSSGQFWAALVFYCGTYGTMMVYAYLWNIQFEVKFFLYTVQHSTLMNAMILLGFTFGGLAVGAWAVKSGFVLPARVFALVTLACFLILFLSPVPVVLAAALLFIIGCGFSSATLGLVALQEHLPAFAAPLATSLVATAAHLFAGAVQPLIGLAIAFPHPAGMILGLVHASTPGFGTFQHGLIWLLACVLSAVVASFCFRPGPRLASARPLATAP
jgi:MFS family permease